MQGPQRGPRTRPHGGVVFLKELGVGTALTILVDATLIRVIPLPVAMRLAGRANWWVPAPLRRGTEVLQREYA